ncbi:MAG TPA: alpha-amylase family protein [Cyclobacteriaceae bacterium]|nr:alpha-amylase family protein [Cyclobacteriaceae bacterium]
MKNIFYLLLLACTFSCAGDKKSSVDSGYSQPGVLWYQKPLRILQTVMRQPDGENYNTDSLISYMEKAHANVLVVNGGGVVDFFQNTLPMANVNSYIGKRDLLDEIVTACHAHGIKVIARVDFRGVEKTRYELHPEWFGRDENGQPILLNYTTPVMYGPCYNSYYRNEHAVEFISTLLGKYHVDGIWHNAVNFHQTCYCERCMKKFFDFCGQKIPTHSSPESDWKEYYRWKALNAEEQLTLMRSTVKKFGEDKAYAAEVFNMYDVEQQRSTGIDLYSAAKFFDFLVTVSFIADNSADVDYKDLSYASGIVKFLKSLNPEKSPVILFGGNGTEHRYIYDAPIDLRQWLWEAAGAGGGFWNCYFNGPYPSATIDLRNAFLPADSYNYLQRNEQLLQSLEPVTDVMVFYSKLSAQMLGDEKFSSPIRGILRMLQDAHFQYGFITDFNFSRENLEKCRALILPNVVILTDDQTRIIREWVNNGGKLMATFETSLYDTLGQKKADFALSDLFGCHFSGEVANTETDCYQKIVTRNEILKGFEQTDLLHSGGMTLICKPGEGSTMVTGYLPKINNQPPENAYPESWDTQNPVIVANQAGKGQVIYFANQPDFLNLIIGHPDYHHLLTNAIISLLGNQKILESNAPASVHIYLNRNTKDHSMIQLSLVNISSGPDRPLRNLIPVRDLDITLPFASIKSCEAISDPKIDFSLNNRTLHIDRITEFCAFKIVTGE